MPLKMVLTGKDYHTKCSRTRITGTNRRKMRRVQILNMFIENGLAGRSGALRGERGREEKKHLQETAKNEVGRLEESKS